MKLHVWMIAALAIPAFAQIERRPISESFPYPQGFTTPQIAPEIPFDMPDREYWKGMPELYNFGEISSVATNSRGHVFILSRSDVSGNIHGGSATQVFEFDETGKWVRELGHKIYGFGYGHGIRVDKNDNIWVVDKGTDMAIQFNNRTGKVMNTLGRREELTSLGWLRQGGGEGGGAAGAAPRGPEEGGFGGPTDIGWDAAGNMYVSDGYEHSRVAKFDKEGNWIGTFGKGGQGNGEFRTVHNIVVDKNDNIWVADRTNGRAQVFDSNGKWLRNVVLNVPVKPGGKGSYQPIMGHQYPPNADTPLTSNMAYRPGTPDGLCIPPTNPNVIFFGDLYPGRVYKANIADGKVLGYFTHVGKGPGETGAIHGLACPTENLVYTAEFENWRVQKFVLHPEKISSTGGAATSAAR